METKTSPLISQMLSFVGTLFIVTYNQDFFSFASNLSFQSSNAVKL